MQGDKGGGTENLCGFCGLVIHQSKPEKTNPHDVLCHDHWGPVQMRPAPPKNIVSSSQKYLKRAQRAFCPNIPHCTDLREAIWNSLKHEYHLGEILHEATLLYDFAFGNSYVFFHFISPQSCRQILFTIYSWVNGGRGGPVKDQANEWYS